MLAGAQQAMRSLPDARTAANDLQREGVLKLYRVLGVALTVGACQPMAAPEAPESIANPEGLAFAEASCGGCHSIVRHGTSPNPSAPTFAGIVNQEGLTAEALSSWLLEAHNYPEEMEFYLDQQEVDELVAYMLTLRDPNYRPPI